MLRLKARKDVLQDALVQQGNTQEYVMIAGKKKRASIRSLATRKNSRTHCALRQDKTCLQTLSGNKEKHKNTM